MQKIFNSIFLSQIKSFLQDSLIYTFINLLNKLIPFILLPILVRIVSVEQYGVYSLFITIETVLVPLISFNIHGALTRHYYLDEKFSLKDYISTMSSISITATVFFFSISILLPYNFNYFSGITKIILVLSVLTSGLSGLINIVSTLLRVKRKPWQFGGYIVTLSIVTLLFTIFMALLNPQAFNLVLGRLMSFLIISILGIIILYRMDIFNLYIKKKWLVRILKFSLPTIPYSFSALVFVFADRFMIEYFLGISHVGYYSAIVQVASMISVLAMSYNAAWVPWLFENLKKKDKSVDLFIIKISYYIMFSFLVAGSIFCLIFPIIAKLVLVKDYVDYLYIGYPIIFGFVLQGCYFVVAPYIFYVEKTSYLAYSGIFVAIINILLNYFLIPRYGIVGSSYSTLVSWLILFILTISISSKIYIMPWRLK